jgi:ubiquinol-cytochrome c reductase cytochrome c1 subunit
MDKIKQFMRATLLVMVMSPLLVFASETEFKLDSAPIKPNDRISLQQGARAFINYCMGCHSAAYMRYSRLTDLDITEQQIKENLILTGAKVGDTMAIAMQKNDAKEWFGATPPDLSVIARSRGVDWLYTYLRTYYKDDSRPTGWNNLAFDKVGMPHVLWQLQGTQILKVSEKEDAHGHKVEERKLVLISPGRLSPKDYDVFVADLVNYLAYMGEPAKTTRTQLGIIVLFYLAFMFVLFLLLKKEYWKDVK